MKGEQIISITRRHYQYDANFNITYEYATDENNAVDDGDAIVTRYSYDEDLNLVGSTQFLASEVWQAAWNVAAAVE